MSPLLFVQKKPEVNSLTLKVITNKEKIHPLTEKRCWKSTLISEEKTYYLYLDKENEDYNFANLYQYFVNFSNSNEIDLNVDIQSFVSDNLTEEKVIQAITEGIIFGSHRAINYKQKSGEIEDEISSFKRKHEGSFIISTTKNSRKIFYDIKKHGEVKIEKGRSYIFIEDYKTEKGSLQIKEIKGVAFFYLITENKNAQKILDKSFVNLKAVNWARDLQDFPPNKLRAKDFARIVNDKFNKLSNIEIEILDKKEIEKNKMGLLLSVNAGSHHEPRVVVLRYFGDKKNKKDILGLIGKGITFDSGGYNLKSSHALETMKFDMSGAAVVCASFLGLIQQNPVTNVVAVACLTDNTIGGHATLTESVITSMSGKTVEINNTDAEGRLVLADGITYAIEKENANRIITVATLTGACEMTLGENTTGVMTNNRDFYQQFYLAAQKSQERIWELPILPENTKALKENTTIADISNIANSRYMGASSGAAFLQEFVGKLPFIHCDIAGTAVKSKSKRGTGVMVKTLIEFFNINKQKQIK
ncbi:MAG: cytosol aminopeptidase [Mycoplasmataceae bacterium]|nr:MAG: cytosol aminopeptidase [Mycoplasmataceae bacterium]